MKKLTAAATCILVIALAGCASVPGSTGEAVRSAAAGTATDAAFDALGKSYIEQATALGPVGATQLGEHRYDANLPDISAAGRARQRAFAQAMLASLGRIDKSALSREKQVDYALLRNSLEYELFQIDELREWEWNPQYYNDTASYALYSLVARDFAPWPDRFENIVSRMERLPAFLAEARRQIVVAKVPKVHAETVAAQNAGIMAIVDSALLPEVQRAGLPRSRFDKALDGLKTAVAEHQKWLDEVVVPGAKGDFRLGAAKYDRKMRYALVSDITRPELLARAQTAYDETRAQMERVARTFPECDRSGQQAAINCALDKTYAVRATRANLEDKARETLAQATAFTAKEGFVRMPDAPTRIITMPVFWQGNAVAYMDSPGPLERDLPGFYAVSPVPEAWNDEQATSFLSEYNMSMLQLLSIHEGVPGHALQINHANKYPDVLRAVLSSGPFIEGWAVYSEKLMADHGYLGGMETEEGRLFILSGLKFRLRSIVNTLLDIRIQTENMSRDEAMKLMMEGGFQTEREAAGKWVRANLSSVQLLSYFTGYSEHVALREEAEQRWGAQFNERAYHDELLAHGSPPVKYARALLLDLPID